MSRCVEAFREWAIETPLRLYTGQEQGSCVEAFREWAIETRLLTERADVDEHGCVEAFREWAIETYWPHR